MKILVYVLEMCVFPDTSNIYSILHGFCPINPPTPSMLKRRRRPESRRWTPSAARGEGARQRLPWRERASLPAELHGIASWNGLVASSASCCMEWSCRENAKNH